MTNGIDVSNYQGDIDWKRVNADFVIIRAGSGSTAEGIDEKFQRNYTGCEENEIPKGCYWFSYGSTVLPEAPNSILQMQDMFRELTVNATLTAAI